MESNFLSAAECYLNLVLIIGADDGGALLEVQHLRLVHDVSLRHFVVVQPREVAQDFPLLRYFHSRRQLSDQIALPVEHVHEGL